MIMKMFSIYDSKAKAYFPPFYCPAAGVAIRNFATAAGDESHEFHKHAADYTLFQIGEFDDATAIVQSLEANINLGTALEHIGDTTWAAPDMKPKVVGIQGGE